MTQSTQSMWESWLLVGLAAISTCMGNILLKKSRFVLTDPGFLPLMTSPWFVGALICYGIDLILFTKALDRLPLSTAVPVASGIGFISVALLSNAFFGERLTFNQLFAASLITAGIVIMSRS